MNQGKVLIVGAGPAGLMTVHSGQNVHVHVRPDQRLRFLAKLWSPTEIERALDIALGRQLRPQ